MSQSDLASAAGIHVTYLSEVERGRRNLALVNIWALADALGIRPGDLFDRASAEPREG
ncbi:MAG TPA: helix-turn-helix transcriptional regulator [Mycobacteriales bacterium]|nr:helix-turn-helix transcriptional regulator [Mycobacteriales bacterium]